MATEKLYWADSTARSFEAPSARLGRWQERPSLVLPRTLFYPEAGGQLADRGKILLGLGDGLVRSLTIEDVQIDDDAVIHHLGPELGALGEPAERELGPARGEIEDARRRDFTAQHTAQHALSRALLDEASAPTVSSRLGATVCTIDVDRADIPEREIARAEDLVNSVVMDDAPVRTLFPTAEELASMDLRRAPKVTADVRIVDIGGFDLSPCGGTHCTRTGQIGSVRVVAVERYKGKTRLSFHAAKRVLDDARAKEAALSQLAARFTCGVLDVGSAVSKLEADLRARTEALAAVRGELVGRIAEDAWREHPPTSDAATFIVLVRPQDDVAALRTLAARVASRADVVAVAASRDRESGDALVVLQRGAAVKAFDCGAWLKSTAAARGGRGGGRPERAEGRLALESLEALASLL